MINHQSVPTQVLLGREQPESAAMAEAAGAERHSDPHLGFDPVTGTKPTSHTHLLLEVPAISLIQIST